MIRRLLGATVCLGMLLLASSAHAIRPFVTDDARVVGHKLAQLETWMVLGRSTLEHNAFAALGPTEWLEITAGLTHGGVHSGVGRGYSIVGPLIQVKALLVEAHDNGRPGVAIAAGAAPPLGYGPFTRPGWGGFVFAALTESLFEERLLLHANVGVAIGDQGIGASGFGLGDSDHRGRVLITTGLGAQARIIAGLHGVAEVYYGDPYDPFSNFGAMQVGFRYIFNDDVQIDGTFGTSLTDVRDASGHVRWGTLGLRLVTPELW